MLLEIYDNSVPKGEYFHDFLSMLCIVKFEKTLRHSDVPGNVNLKIMIFEINVADFSEHFKILKKNFLIDTHVKTLLRMQEFYLKLLNFRQGEQH